MPRAARSMADPCCAVRVDAEALDDELPWLGVDHDVGRAARAAGKVEFLLELDGQIGRAGQDRHLRLEVNMPQSDGL